MSRNIRSLSARNSQVTTLFELLTGASKQNGCLSEAQLSDVSQKTSISVAHLLATSSFYDFLNADNSNKRAYMCTGTSCMLRGRQHQVRAALLQNYPGDEIGEVRCLGHCYRGEAFIEGDHIHDVGQCYPGDKGNANRIPFYALSSVSMFADLPDSSEKFYLSVLLDADEIKQQLKDSALRGRGGAGFPFASKLIACADAPGKQKYVVCNADEGDPGAFSDRYLLEQQAHAVLAGMLASARACGADTGYLYIRAEYPQAQKNIQQAVADFEQTAAYQQTHFKFHIFIGAGSYVCGEETALLNSIEGLKPEVRVRPPYPAQQGLFSQPTLISNVETFAAVPWILQNTGTAFANIGTTKSTGTKLISLDHGFKRPGVYEVDMGESVQKIIVEFAGGFSSEIKAIQVGGPLGGVIPLAKIADLTLDFESFDEQGFLLGHAGFIAIPESFPMIDFMRHLFEFMAQESCGKCLPCRLGTKKGHDMLLTASLQSPVNGAAFNDLLDTLELGSLCGLGSGLPLPVRNIMTYFADELADFFIKESES